MPARNLAKKQEYCARKQRYFARIRKKPQESCKNPARISCSIFFVFLNFLAGKLWPTCGGSGGNHRKESERVGWPERVRKELFFIVFLGIFWCCKEFNKTCVPERVRKELCCKSFCKNLARILKNPARSLQEFLAEIVCFFEFSCRTFCGFLQENIGFPGFLAGFLVLDLWFLARKTGP